MLLYFYLLSILLLITIFAIKDNCYYKYPIGTGKFMYDKLPVLEKDVVIPLLVSLIPYVGTLILLIILGDTIQQIVDCDFIIKFRKKDKK